MHHFPFFLSELFPLDDHAFSHFLYLSPSLVFFDEVSTWSFTGYLQTFCDISEWLTNHDEEHVQYTLLVFLIADSAIALSVLLTKVCLVWINCRLKMQCSCSTKSHSVTEVRFVALSSTYHMDIPQVESTIFFNYRKTLNTFTSFLKRSLDCPRI